MSVGNIIYELRTSKNLSQEALADMLDVSRQSVSKWETDSAIPDLDKLIKLCDIFGVTLDEITGRDVTKAQTTSKVKPDNSPSTTQRVIGYILFTFSILLGFVILFFGTNEGDYIILSPIAISLLVCGLLCLFAGKKAFYWCIWTALAPVTALTPHLVSFPVNSALTVILIVVAVIMIFVANAVFKDIVIHSEKKKSVLLVFGWLMAIALYVLNLILPSIYTQRSGTIAYNEFTSIILNFICYALLACLETYTVCYLRKTK